MKNDVEMQKMNVSNFCLCLIHYFDFMKNCIIDMWKMMMNYCVN